MRTWQSSVPRLCNALSTRFRNLIVGAGPGGFAVTSTLLDGGSEPVLWVDPEFESGRLKSYLEVPSNTKAKLFVQYGSIPSQTADSSHWATEQIQAQDQEKGCQLSLAQEMVVKLTQHLHESHCDKVTLRKGIVDSLSLHDDIWSVNNGVAFAERVFLVTGSHPRDESPYPDIPVMELDDALIPSKLAGLVSHEDTVCVVGSSHSAILVLMNLLEMNNGPKVLNLYRSPLKYAKFLEDGTVIRDNTGLKGLAAEWARDRLETGYFQKDGRLQRINTKERDPVELIGGCTQIVNAVGFQRNALPDITVDGERLTDIKHDPRSGVIIPGKLFGFGIAFPEEITDPEFGHQEANVGLMKFMKFVRRTLPAQQLCQL